MFRSLSRSLPLTQFVRQSNQVLSNTVRFHGHGHGAGHDHGDHSQCQHGASFDTILQNNRRWVARTTSEAPDFFKELAKDQKPNFLWIGCSDSRVPAEQVCGLQPGEMFVHRNIANQIIMTDFNVLSVLQYAVDVLGVNNIIVCGHYGCGGVLAALKPQDPRLTITNKWLMHLKDLYRLHSTELDTAAAPQQKANRLVELNVIEQVLKLSHTSIIQKNWKAHNRPNLYGVVYDLADGFLQPLITLDPATTKIDPIYKYAEEK